MTPDQSEFLQAARACEALILLPRDPSDRGLDAVLERFARFETDQKPG